MEPTNEFYAEICQLIDLARHVNPLITQYVQHSITINPCNGYIVELTGNRRLFISKYLLQDYAACPQMVLEEDIKHIAESLEEIKE